MSEEATPTPDPGPASDNRLRMALSAARVGTWTWDPASDLHIRDAVLNRLLGLPAVKTAQPLSDFLALVHPDDRRAVRAALTASVRRGDPLNVEFRVVRPDGAVRWLRDQGDLVQSVYNLILAGAVSDVTERREAQDALRASEDRLRRVLDAATDYAIFTLDPLRRITSWSPGAEALFGYALREVLGRPGDLLFTPEDRAAGAPEEEQLAADRRGRASHERWHLRMDGSRFFASGVLTPYGLSGSQGYVKVLRDLTERKRMEDELRAARDELGVRVEERTRELAAALDALEAEMARRAELTRRLATAQEAERRRLARDLHDTAGQTLTALGLAAAAGNMAQVRELAADLGRELHEVAVRLRPTVLDDVGLTAAVRVLCDEWTCRTGVPVEFEAVGVESERLPPEVETTLYRVAQEALTNAARHAGATRVSLMVGRRDNDAVAVVEDDGGGFDPEAPRTLTPGRTGGLGLPGMRERVALLGGSVEVESAPGQGTTVIARIPLGEVTAGPAG
jgi:PAS domain S-box-containing protein